MPRTDNPRGPFNPFAPNGLSALDRHAPTTNPFAGPPEPLRTIPEALLEAFHRAYGEWREVLPHGLSVDAYKSREPEWLLNVATSAAAASAAAPLAAALPADQVSALATTLAMAAFTACLREVSQSRS